MTASEGSFLMLVRASGNDSSAGPGRTLLLGGENWCLEDWGEIQDAESVPSYTCVSYAWGSAVSAHPFDPSTRIAARTVEVAETAIAAFAPDALWIDAICVPSEPAARRRCLRHLGAIYARATQVVAVLSPECSAVLTALALDDRSLLDPRPLEDDDWVARAWTYQEILNSRNMYFVAGRGGDPMTALALLDGLGHFMVDRERSLGIDAFALKALYPRLDQLQDLLADWQMGSYLERPAFQVISGMTARRSSRGDDIYDAMVGIVEDVTAEQPARLESLTGFEAFLCACESKGDYSYIYAVALRGDAPGRSWRPVASDGLRTPIAWHSFGPGQPGAMASSHLRLDDVAVLRRGSVEVDAQARLCGWLGVEARSFDARCIAERAYRRLCDAGFDGASSSIEMVEGIVFAQSEQREAANLDIVVPLGVRWVHGAPALLLERVAYGARRFRDVGVFVGTVPQAGISIDVE